MVPQTKFIPIRYNMKVYNINKALKESLSFGKKRATVVSEGGIVH